MDQARIDNYLDLLLYAGEIGDTEWQAAIKRKLQDFLETEETVSNADDLETQYFAVNRNILELYRVLHKNDSTDQALRNRLFDLKKRRIEIGKQIDSLKSLKQNSFR